MVLEGAWSVFGLGCAGGIAAEVLHWWNLRQAEKLPIYAKKAFYWSITIVMILLGGFVSWLYFGATAEGIVAFHVGLSTPLLLQKLVASIPEETGARNTVLTSSPTLRRFFSW
ncbi:hypothetical protein [Pseudohalioglobus lutimaris]|uniref:hypothetical protein n=1 Tax=Pseudohalioglobus lutimaris TaxID=1737061 RepID=UPI00105630BC|nr:hypothetical protein [Pseudohalioglobus lutimaris]